MIVSGGKQRGSATHHHVSILPQARLPSCLPFIDRTPTCVSRVQILLLNPRICLNIYLNVPQESKPARHLPIPVPIHALFLLLSWLQGSTLQSPPKPRTRKPSWVPCSPPQSLTPPLLHIPGPHFRDGMQRPPTPPYAPELRKKHPSLRKQLQTVTGLQRHPSPGAGVRQGCHWDGAGLAETRV